MPVASRTISRRRSSSFSLTSLVMWKRSNTIAALGQILRHGRPIGGAHVHRDGFDRGPAGPQRRPEFAQGIASAPWATQTMRPVSKSMTSVQNHVPPPEVDLVDREPLSSLSRG